MQDIRPTNILSLVTDKRSLSEINTSSISEHRVIEFADITAPKEGYVLAQVNHIQSILDFTRSWDQTSPLIIHCFAGVSRSPAAAFIATCDLMPAYSESQLAQELRQQSPCATPNIHLVQLADDILNRNGRMVDAIRSIGRGADAFEGEVFCFPVRSSC
ncbi:tyrosine protein phosphatase [Microvirga sp. W0021]|uniref:Tyrosine protein phosphatase n=1 Tax=Hohaiivirga grylli TaxID=3133970 RepID=A0ABV0BHT5_9HYPH